MSSPEDLDLSNIKNATALINPVSTTSRRGVRRLKRLIEQAPFTIEAIPTSKNRNITKAIIGASLENSDLLLIVAGDGTMKTVVDTIVANNLSDQAKQTPLWCLGGGNAEDGHKAKHTPLHRRHPEKVLQDGRIMETYPIRCDINTTDGEHIIHSAAFYATLGATALASSDLFLNNDKHRNSWLGYTKLGRLISEPIVVANALLSAPVNNVIEDGKNRHFYEEIFANSHIMAKYMHFPTNLTQKELFHAEITDKKLFSVTRSVVKGIRGNLQGTTFTGCDQMNFRTTDPLWSQFDGEATSIPTGSDVSIKIHDKPLYVVVSNPDL